MLSGTGLSGTGLSGTRLSGTTASESRYVYGYYILLIIPLIPMLPALLHSSAADTSWAVTATLLVAAVHLGKAATFRNAGIPVPEGSAQADLARLERLVQETAARRLIVLGDLFHARSGCTQAVFDEFAATRSRMPETEVLLIAGNHDRAATGRSVTAQ